MPTFEEIIRSSNLTHTVNDTEWMRGLGTWLRGLPDDYLAEAMRFSFMACAIRLSGESPSFEGMRHNQIKLLELLKESLNVE